MAAYEVLTINTNIPQIQAPQSGDTYSFPRVAEFIAGTAAAPALTTTGDTDTGVFFPAANTWAVATGASERMRIDSSGNVGIGDTSPSSRGRLSVISTTGVGRQFVVKTDGSAEVRFNDNGNPRAFSLQNYGMTGANQGASILWSLGDTTANANDAGAIDVISEGTWGATAASRDSAMRFQTTIDGNINERMRIDSSGNVGIGTTSPAVRLDVAEADITQIRAVATTNGVDTRLNSLGQSANAGVVGTYSNHPFLLYTNSSERMRITSGGNVGIGTNNPAVKLEVAGQIRTEAPTGGTAANWRLGTVHTVSPTSPNRTIEVDIGGTIYYLHAKTTNN